MLSPCNLIFVYFVFILFELLCMNIFLFIFVSNFSVCPNFSNIISRYSYFSFFYLLHLRLIFPNSFNFILFSSILFHSILSYSILFNSILLYSILYRSNLIYSVLFNSTLLFSILLYSDLLYLLLFWSIPFHSILFLSYSILFTLSSFF